MKTFRYTLEPYKGTNSRYTCPQCGGKKVFVRYIDTQTHQHVSDDIGRCNREEKCGYHKKPQREVKSEMSKPKIVRVSPKPKPSLTTNALCLTPVFENSKNNYQNNQLVLYLHDTLGYKAMERVVDAYHIGTHGTSTVFWQIDSKGEIRGGKVMAYDKHTGKRVKDIPNAIQWMHTIHKIENYQLNQCLFGEHLLRDNTQQVGIVESEKTALIAAALMPDIIWLATGGINNLTAERCKILGARRVTLYPDAGAYDKWLAVNKLLRYSISPMLEHGNFSTGCDIADYLLAA